jgi:polysaccharide biosynthesis transport protein
VREFLAATRFDPRAPDRETSATGRVTTSPRDDETVTALKASIVGLEAQLTEARQIYTPAAEPVRRLERTLEESRTRLAAEIDVGANNFSRYDQLDRALRTAESRAEELERRREQIALFLQINRDSTGNRLVIEPPQRPESSDWKPRVATAMLGSFMGLVLGIALAGLAEYADSSLGSREDVRRHLGVEALATIPKASAREVKSVFAAEAAVKGSRGMAPGRLARPVEALTSRLTAGMHGPHTPGCGLAILVTSAHAGEGKTFTAALLAGELVRLGVGSVLLVDVNDHGHSPMVASGVPYSTRLDDRRTLESGSTDGCGLEAAPLTVLAVGNRYESAADLVGTRLHSFVERERARFDWIIFDGRPVDGHGMTALAREVDGVLLVVEADSTRRHVVEHAIDVLDLERGNTLAVVLNRKRHYIPAFLYDRV